MSVGRRIVKNNPLPPCASTSLRYTHKKKHRRDVTLPIMTSGAGKYTSKFPSFKYFFQMGLKNTIIFFLNNPCILRHCFATPLPPVNNSNLSRLLCFLQKEFFLTLSFFLLPLWCMFPMYSLQTFFYIVSPPFRALPVIYCPPLPFFSSLCKRL